MKTCFLMATDQDGEEIITGKTNEEMDRHRKETGQEVYELNIASIVNKVSFI